MRAIGLHLRLTSSLSDLIKKALRLRLSCFQCFFISQATGRFIKLDNQDVKSFLTLRRTHFDALYVHASYWINLSNIYRIRHPILERELALAKRLEFTHIILHPGSAKGAIHKQEGIDALARTLNAVLKKERTIQIVLENTAHGALSIGGDMHDFKLLLGKLDYPERIAFCIDTSHAYSFGYDIANDKGRAAFINVLEQTIGFDNIALIHLNDTREQLGSKIDKHYMVGKGNIGKEALKKFILYPRLMAVPLLMEPPILSAEEETAIVKEIVSWHKSKGS